MKPQRIQVTLTRRELAALAGIETSIYTRPVAVAVKKLRRVLADLQAKEKEAEK